MRKLARFLCLSVVCASINVQSALANNASQVSESIWVNASPKACWDAIRNPASCLDHRRIVCATTGNVLVEETYDNLPGINSCVCIFRESEQPMQWLNYRLVSSTRFKAMEGTWRLAPGQDGGTVVSLSSLLDTGIHLPFARKVADSLNTKKCKERLNLVKSIAETGEHQRIASN
jgi:hypothetical protein